jgi:hypothetical protein
MTEMSTDCDDQEGIELWPLIESYCADVDRELAARQNAWPPDFAQIHVHEVIGGMLAREATLAKDVARAPALWTGHSAPILLRAMADAYINMAWLLLDPVERCRKFILFGLGQAKLELEHRRAQIGTREPTLQEAAMLEAGERWIDSQRIGGLLRRRHRKMVEPVSSSDGRGSGLHRFLQLRLHPVQRVCSFDVAPCCALRSQAVRQSIAPAPSSSDQRGTSPGPPLSDARREVLEQDARHLRSDARAHDPGSVILRDAD